MIGFNPRPLLLTGESAARRMTTRRTGSFNPRPLLLTGESGFEWFEGVDFGVSIHARYC